MILQIKQEVGLKGDLSKVTRLLSGRSWTKSGLFNLPPLPSHHPASGGRKPLPNPAALQTLGITHPFKITKQTHRVFSRWEQLLFTCSGGDDSVQINPPHSTTWLCGHTAAQILPKALSCAASPKSEGE